MSKTSHNKKSFMKPVRNRNKNFSDTFEKRMSRGNPKEALKKYSEYEDDFYDEDDNYFFDDEFWNESNR